MTIIYYLFFIFVIDRIQNHHKYKAKGDDEENLAILTCSLDYTKMSEDEISSLLSLEENLSIFHPINPEERMKTFINEATKYQLKILELEKMLKQLLSKENENEERINNLEKQFMPKNDNKNIIRNFDYSDYYSDDQYDNINTNSEQQFIQEEDNDDNKERNTNPEQQSIQEEDDDEERNTNSEQQFIQEEDDDNEERNTNSEPQSIQEEENGSFIQILIKNNNCHEQTQIAEINVKSTISSFIEEYKGSNDYYLCCNGIVLDSNLKFEDYFITFYSQIYCIKNDDNIVFIKKNDYEYVPISFEPYNKVDDLVNKLSFLSFQYDEHKLIYENKELEMGVILQDYSITNGSTIIISPPINVIIGICLKTNLCFWKYYGKITVNLTDKINVLTKYLNNFRDSSLDIEDVFFYDDVKLDTNKTFQDYQIKNDSDIFVYERINTFDISVLENTVKIQGNYKIKDAKMEIQRKTGIPCDEQKLFALKRELLDYEFISFYTHEIIEFHHFTKGSKLIYIEFDTNFGKFNDFIIFKDPLQIDFLMQKLHELTCLKYFPEETALIFNGQKLDKSKTLDDYDIPQESDSKLTFTVNFECDHRHDSHMQVFIKCRNGKHITIVVSPNDLVEMIRYDYCVKAGFHFDITLIYASRKLQDGNILQDYSIQKDSTIHSVLRLRG